MKVQLKGRLIIDRKYQEGSHVALFIVADVTLDHDCLGSLIGENAKIGAPVYLASNSFPLAQPASVGHYILNDVRISQ